MYKDEIIDGHMHLWDLDHGDYPWLTEKKGHFDEIIGKIDQLYKNFLVTDYEALVKPYHVTKCVHLEANPSLKKSLYETEWLQKIADHHGFPNGIVFQADLRDPDIENVLKDHCQFPNTRGVRQILFHEEGASEPDLINDLHWQRGLKALAKQILSFDIAIFSPQIPDAARLVKEHPDVSFVLNHLGWPRDVTDQGFETWKRDIRLLAEHPNVHLKLSGIGLVFQADDRENIKRFLHAGIEIFGEDRCFFASNIPPDSLFLPYGKIIEISRDAYTRYSLETQRKLFYENAKAFYDL
ncbi:MAG: amidohydrolase family protein [Chlamydiia bacterium]|nr:amidohydrolase family protein [Chlamydiia bacterium]